MPNHPHRSRPRTNCPPVRLRPAVGPRSSGRTAVLAALILLLAGIAPAHARVFSRWQAVERSDEAVKALGGQLAYEAAIRLNAGTGQLAVFSFDRTIEDVIAGLRRVLGASALAVQGVSMGLGTVRGEGRVLRLLVIRLESSARTIVFRIEQTEAEFARSAAPPPSADVAADLSAFPGSTPLFLAGDENARMAFSVSRARADPIDVRDYYARRLQAEGWKSALPPRPSAVGPGMDAYAKGSAVCTVFVDGPDGGGEVRITLLHKQGGTE